MPKTNQRTKPSFNTATKSTFNGWNANQTPKLDASMSQAANSINESMRAAFLPVYFTKTTIIKDKNMVAKQIFARNRQTITKIATPETNN